MSEELPIPVKRALLELQSRFDQLVRHLPDLNRRSVPLGDDDITGGGGGGGGDVDWSDITGKPSVFPPAAHVHPIDDVTGLTSALDGKSNVGHSHAIADVSGLSAALDGKQPVGSYAAAVHTHPITDVTGLTSALDGKSNVGHGHAIADVSGLTAALDGKQPVGSYAAAVHGHAIDDVTGLTAALDGKAPLARALPSGGAVGQVLAKASATDYDVAWTTPSGGGAPFTAWRFLTADRDGIDTASVWQSFFAATEDELGIPNTGLYRFWSSLILSNMSATSGNASVAVNAGTAAFTAFVTEYIGADLTAYDGIPGTLSGRVLAGFAGASSNSVSAGTGTAMRLSVSGFLNITTAGTILPQFRLPAAASGLIVRAGTGFFIERVGDTGSSAGTWS